MRQYQLNPSSAILTVLDIVMEEMRAIVDLKTATLRDEVKKDAPDLFKALESIRGEDGEDADPQEVAEHLMEMPEFCDMSKGEQGEQGPAGKNGLPGPAGLNGKDGVNGLDGKDGIDGLDGADGKDGKDGVDGKDGSPDSPIQIADKLNTLDEKVEMKVIKGLDTQLKNLSASIREKAGTAKGGGMGNVQHETKNLTSATTTVSTNYKIAGNGYAIWTYYQGQLIMRGTAYTVGSDLKTLSLLFTPVDGTFIDIIYIR